MEVQIQESKVRFTNQLKEKEAEKQTLKSQNQLLQAKAQRLETEKNELTQNFNFLKDDFDRLTIDYRVLLREKDYNTTLMRNENQSQMEVITNQHTKTIQKLTVTQEEQIREIKSGFVSQINVL